MSVGIVTRSEAIDCAEGPRGCKESRALSAWRKACGPGCRGGRQIVAEGDVPVRIGEVQGRCSITDHSRQKARRHRSGPSTSRGSAPAPSPPGDAANRQGKRGNGPSDNQRVPVIFPCCGRQDGQPSTGIDPEGAADHDRIHLKRLRLPEVCPAPGDGGFSAECGRRRAACIDGGELVWERWNRRHGGGL